MNKLVTIYESMSYPIIFVDRCAKLDTAFGISYINLYIKPARIKN